jgi:transcriptional regulator with XRE-family HTH domain
LASHEGQETRAQADFATPKLDPAEARPMDVCSVIRQRLLELGLEQKDLAAAAKVTDSYISQLLTRKKRPPAPDRTDIYDKMTKFLKLPKGQLSKLADLQRKEEMKRYLGEPPAPLFPEVRELILRKCVPASEKQLRAIFEKEAFGELEHLVTQRLLELVKRVVREELGSENWLRLVGRLTDRSYEQTRVLVIEFLDTEAFNVSLEHGLSFLDPLIDSWVIDLGSFAMEIVLNPRLAPGRSRRFEFVEQNIEPATPEELAGLREFLSDPTLSGDATNEEVEFLKTLRLKGKQPTATYYYRELQNLRDPIHFRGSAKRVRRAAPDTLGSA